MLAGGICHTRVYDPQDPVAVEKCRKMFKVRIKYINCTKMTYKNTLQNTQMSMLKVPGQVFDLRNLRERDGRDPTRRCFLVLTNYKL